MYNLDIDPFLRSNSCVQVYISLLWLGLIIQTKTRVYLRECQAQLQWPSPPCFAGPVDYTLVTIDFAFYHHVAKM